MKIKLHPVLNDLRHLLRSLPPLEIAFRLFLYDLYDLDVIGMLSENVVDQVSDHACFLLRCLKHVYARILDINNSTTGFSTKKTPCIHKAPYLNLYPFLIPISKERVSIWLTLS